MSNIATTQSTSLLDPSQFDKVWEISGKLAGSDLVPKNYKNKPMDIIVAWEYGNEIGLGRMASLQNIAVVNGRPSVYGDAFRALIMSCPDLVSIKETLNEQTLTATCVIERKMPGGGISTFTGTFSSEDAQKAGLWGKQGPWTQYPKRMLQWRAMGWAGRDAFPDRLAGIWIEAEVMDIPAEREINHVQRQQVKTKSNTLASVLATANGQEQQEQVIDVETEQAQEEQQSAYDNLQMTLVNAADAAELQLASVKIVEAVAAGHITQDERDDLANIYRQRKTEVLQGGNNDQ
jgi:hypothetical protein